jgi:hypothetical protein
MKLVVEDKAILMNVIERHCKWKRRECRIK